MTQLIPIMKEKVSKLNEKKLPAVHVSSEMEESAEDAILKGKYGVVYISQEQFLRQVQWREMLLSEVYQKNLHVVCFVVDEAHCVRWW